MYLTEPKSPWKSHVSRPQWPVAGLWPFILLQFIKLTFPIASDKDVDKSYGTQLNIQAREHSLIDFFKKAYFPVYIWEKNDTQESLGNSPVSHSKQVIFEDANSCVLILNLIDVSLHLSALWWEKECPLCSAPSMSCIFTSFGE